MTECQLTFMESYGSSETKTKVSRLQFTFYFSVNLVCETIDAVNWTLVYNYLDNKKKIFESLINFSYLIGNQIKRLTFSRYLS